MADFILGKEWRFKDATIEDLQKLYDLIPHLSSAKLLVLEGFVFENDYWFATDEPGQETGVKWLIQYLQNRLE